MNNINKKYILMYFLLSLSTLLNAKEIHTYELQIRAFIEDKHSINVEVDKKNEGLIFSVKNVWSRSNVQICKTPLIIESVQKKYIGSLSIKITCDSTKWSMYVPVYVGQNKEVIVLKTNVERGVEFAPSMLIHQVQDIGRLTQGYYTDKNQLIEKSATRHLKAAQVLNPMMVDDIDLVLKGDRVMIVIKKGELKVQMPGIALASGERGKQISVRNRSSKRIVKAVIKEKGLVEIII